MFHVLVFASKNRKPHNLFSQECVERLEMGVEVYVLFCLWAEAVFNSSLRPAKYCLIFQRLELGDKTCLLLRLLFIFVYNFYGRVLTLEFLHFVGIKMITQYSKRFQIRKFAEFW